MSSGSADTELDAMTPSEAAGYWHARSLKGNLTPAEMQALQNWLGASPTHRNAYERGEQALEAFNGHADIANLRALRKSAMLAGPDRRPRRGRAAGAVALLAASLVLAAGWLLLPVWFAGSAGEEAGGALARHYQTQIGERLEVVLADGTMATLNTATRLSVEYSDSERVIRLVWGQAYFDVARDEARPFSVVVDETRVTALGTAFEVRREDNRVDVALVRGSVVVQPERGTQGFASAVTLAPGQRFVETKGQPSELRTLDIQRELRWREGFIEFDDELLASALEEINRYTRTPIVATDRRLEEMRISGLYRAGRPEGFLDAVSAVLPARIVRGHDQILIVWTDGA